VALSWAPPVSNGGSPITGYEVSIERFFEWESAETDTSHVFTNLDHGDHGVYHDVFLVRAVNAEGPGEAARLSAAPFSTPSQPLNLAAAMGNAAIVLTWEAPENNGGSPVTGFEVTHFQWGAWDGSWIEATGSSSHTFSGLTVGADYRFGVRAVNAVGYGAEDWIAKIPGSGPSAPHDLRLTIGEGDAGLSWSLPLSDGGSQILYFEVSIDGGISWVTTMSHSSHTFTGLASPWEYTYRVRAVTAVGHGDEAFAALPTAPQNLAAILGEGQIKITWEAPARKGSSPIDRFIVNLIGGNFLFNSTADSETSHTFTDLGVGIEYTFLVRTLTAQGWGQEAAITAALPFPPEPPHSPINLTAAPGNAQIQLTWEAPEFYGFSPIWYEVRYTSGGGQSEWLPADSDTSHTFTGLANGIRHLVSVRAVNIAGYSWGAGIHETPGTVPSAPQNLRVTWELDRVVQVSWDPPEYDGGSWIFGYQVSFNNGVTWLGSDRENGHSFSDLTNGTTYTFRVRAVNLFGHGPEATVTGSPFTYPSAPLNLTAIAGNGQITLTWNPPQDDGGRPITGFIVMRGSISYEMASYVTSYIFTGLPNGVSQSFSVRALTYNAGYVIEGERATVAATPFGVPGAPQSFHAAPGHRRVALSWTPPSNNGGSPITGFEVYRDGVGGGAWLAASSGTGHIFTGLTNGQNYTFRVRAVNAGGAGAEVTANATPFHIPFSYQITGASGAFTATRGGITVVAANQPIQTVIDAVRADAEGEDVVIRFGSGAPRLDIGTASASFNNAGGGTWGTITLEGGITSANTDVNQGTVEVAVGVTVNSTGEIANTGSFGGLQVPHAINNRGIVNIQSGVVSALVGIAVYNRNTGSVNVSGGTVSTTSETAILCNGEGTIAVRGGFVTAPSGTAIGSMFSGQITVSGTAVVEGLTTAIATSGWARLEVLGGQLRTLSTNSALAAAIRHNSIGGVTISGGSVSVISGAAIVSSDTGIVPFNTGLVTISGTALISSQGRSVITINGTGTATRLAVTGGAISNLATFIQGGAHPFTNAITNHSTGGVIVTGGTLSVGLITGDFAVENTNPNATLVLGGAPNINGRLRIAPGRLSVESNSFGGRVFMLDPLTPANGQVAVANGAGVLGNFALHNPVWRLAAEGGNLVIRPNP